MTNRKWIFAAAAAIVIVAAVGYFGTRQEPSDDAAAGAIGAVKKHRAPQITEQDVVLGSEAAAPFAPYADLFGDAALLGNMSASLESMVKQLQAATTLEQREALQADVQGIVTTLESRVGQLGQRMNDEMRVELTALNKVLGSQDLDTSGTIARLKTEVGDVSRILGSGGSYPELSTLPGRILKISNDLAASSGLDAKSLDSLSLRLNDAVGRLENATDLNTSTVRSIQNEIDQVRTVLGARVDEIAAASVIGRGGYLGSLDLQSNTLQNAKLTLADIKDKLGASTQLEAQAVIDALRPQFTNLASKLLEQKAQLEDKAVLGLTSQLEAVTLQAKFVQEMNTKLNLAAKTLESHTATMDRDAFKSLEASLKAMSDVLGSQTLDTNRQIGRLVDVQSSGLNAVLQNQAALGSSILLDRVQGHVKLLGSTIGGLDTGGAMDLQGTANRLLKLNEALNNRTAVE